MLILPDDARASIERTASFAYPDEACGLLLGRRLARAVLVVQAPSARNLAVTPRESYLLDPMALLRAASRASGLGLELVGVWHSHPDRLAFPSHGDRCHAWEGWSYLIVGLERGQPAELRSWRLRSGRLREEAIEQRPARRHLRPSGPSAAGLPGSAAAR